MTPAEIILVAINIAWLLWVRLKLRRIARNASIDQAELRHRVSSVSVEMYRELRDELYERANATERGFEKDLKLYLDRAVRDNDPVFYSELIKGINQFQLNNQSYNDGH